MQTSITQILIVGHLLPFPTVGQHRTMHDFSYWPVLFGKLRVQGIR